MGRSSGLGMRKPQAVTSLRFRRDEKGEGRYGPQQRSGDAQTADRYLAALPSRWKTAPFQQLLFPEAPLSPLSSRPKGTHVCCSPSRMQILERHGSQQEIRGSEVERSLCGCAFLGMFFA
jgi:hypothetical protein